MAGRTTAEAVHNFLDPLQRAVSCVVTAPLTVKGGYYQSEKPHILLLGDGTSLKLSGDTGLTLKVAHSYRLVEDTGPRGPWKVSTAGYIYEIGNRRGEPLVSYHWHPLEQSGVTFPHLHLYVGNQEPCRPISDQIGCRDLDKKHLPTERIALEQVLRLLIADFGVRPLHDNWEQILDDSEMAFKAWRTWPR